MSILLYDNGPNADDRIIMFATEYNLSLLARSDMWFVDGNFGLAPEFFKQLYVVRVQINLLQQFIASFRGKINQHTNKYLVPY